MGGGVAGNRKAGWLSACGPTLPAKNAGRMGHPPSFGLGQFSKTKHMEYGASLLIERGSIACWRLCLSTLKKSKDIEDGIE